MSRRLTVELWTARGTLLEDVDVSVTDDAAVDFARRKVGVSPSDFNSGEMVS